MEFGLTNKKIVEDKYPNNAIITLPAYDEEAGTKTKISFNRKAYEILGLTEDAENEVAFSTSKSDIKKTFLINANDYNSSANIKLRKNGSYSNKRNFRILKERFNTEIGEELLLQIVDTERVYEGQVIYGLEKFTPIEATELAS